jgi:hypothetical protein
MITTMSTQCWHRHPHYTTSLLPSTKLTAASYDKLVVGVAILHSSATKPLQMTRTTYGDNVNQRRRVRLGEYDDGCYMYVPTREYNEGKKPRRRWAAVCFFFRSCITVTITDTFYSRYYYSTRCTQHDDMRRRRRQVGYDEEKRPERHLQRLLGYSLFFFVISFPYYWYFFRY